LRRKRKRKRKRKRSRKRKRERKRRKIWIIRKSMSKFNLKILISIPRSASMESKSKAIQLQKNVS
jgi:hypothetical protein